MKEHVKMFPIDYPLNQQKIRIICTKAASTSLVWERADEHENVDWVDHQTEPIR